MSLGQNIRTLRTKRKLKQHELAKKLGVAQSTICDLESGVTTSPRFTTLKKVAKFFDVPVARLLA